METLDRIIELLESKKAKDNSTNKDFLAYIGLSKTALCDWKQRGSKSYIKHIDKIATYFDVSTDYLLCEDYLKYNEKYINTKIYKEVSCSPFELILFALQYEE